MPVSVIMPDAIAEYMPIAEATLMVEENFGKRVLVKRGTMEPAAIAVSAYTRGGEPYPDLSIVPFVGHYFAPSRGKESGIPKCWLAPRPAFRASTFIRTDPLDSFS
jgi:hypothetical protein